MAENGDVYVIDIQAKLTNKISDGVDKAEKDADRLGKALERTQKQLDKVSKMEANLTIGADDKASASINRAQKAASSFGHSTAKKVIGADDRASDKIDKAQKKADKFDKSDPDAELGANDRASDKIDKAQNKANGFGKSNPTTKLGAIDRASQIIGNVLGAAKSFGGKVFKATLSIIDDATKPLQWVKDQIFSIKGLIAGLATGVAAQQLITNPISLADTWEQAYIGFETMLGSKEAADKMMEEIKQFAITTPFDTTGVTAGAQQLLRSGYGQDEIIPMLTKLGNANASAGGTTEDLTGIITAVNQISMAGKLNAQDAMQLTNRNIDIWRYLAEYYGTDKVSVKKMSSEGKISSEDAIAAMMKGVEEFDGMMDKMSNRTVRGLLSNIKDTFDTGIVLKWGKGLQKGATEGLGKFADYLDEIDPLLEKAGTSLEEMGEAASKWVFGLLEGAGERLKEVLSSDEFKNAEGFDKIKVAWDKVIGDPLSQWWETKGLPMFEDYSGKIGKVLGDGLKGGLLALLGVDIEGASSDGAKIGKSFAEGFLEGFEGEKVAEALKTALGNMIGSSAKILPGNEEPTAGSWVSAGILTYLGAKLGLGKLVGGTMKGIGSLIANFGTGGGTALSLSSFLGSLAKGTGLAGIFGKAGLALGGGTTAAGGATAGTAAMGGASIFGGILGALGIGNGAWDLFKGFTADNQEEKEKRLWRGGTKLGMVAGGVGGGAGIGALIGMLGGPIGAGAGALIGAGIGGIGTFFGGNKAADWMREKFNAGNEKAGGSLGKTLLLGSSGGLFGMAALGALDVHKDDIVKFFTKTFPKKWDEFWKATGDFFTETVPEAVSNFGEKCETFFTETVPEKWNEFWEPIGEFFTEKIPEAASRIGEKIGAFFTETIPEKWGEFTDAIEEFVTETVPYAIGYAAGRVYAFFTETLPEKWDEFLESVGEFFTETLPEFKDSVMEKATTFWNETIVAGWNDFWDGVGEFFTETLPESKDSIVEKVTAFWNDTVVAGWNGFWAAVGLFFTETLPELKEKAVEKVTTFWNDTVVAGWNGFWDDVKTWWNEELPKGLEKIQNSISTFITETVPGWFTGLFASAKEKWNSIKSNFSLGWGDGKEDGDSKGNNAHGGVVQSKMLSWLGEEGPEAVIPLNPARRDRALSLWMQTGQRLGVAAHANGGIVGDISAAKAAYRDSVFARSALIYDKTKRATSTPAKDVTEIDDLMVNVVELKALARERARKMAERTSSESASTAKKSRSSSGSDSYGGRSIADSLSTYSTSDSSGSGVSVSSSGDGYNITVNIEGINFNINTGGATDPESIIAAIRANSDEFTDMMADMLEAALREAFQNIPKAS